MRHTIFLFLLLPAFLWGQYPNNARKQRLGYQTTGAGLVYIKSGAPSHTPADDEDAWMVLDTTNNALYYYDEAAGAWENILDDVVRDTVFRITSVPDTSTIVPLQGDLFINATADTLGAYDPVLGWQLYTGDGNGIYDGSGTVPANTTITLEEGTLTRIENPDGNNAMYWNFSTNVWQVYVSDLTFAKQSDIFVQSVDGGGTPLIRLRAQDDDIATESQIIVNDNEIKLNTTGSVSLYNDSYLFPDATPSTTLNDTTVMAWRGTGSGASPVGFVPYGGGGGGSGTVDHDTSAYFHRRLTFGTDYTLPAAVLDTADLISIYAGAQTGTSITITLPTLSDTAYDGKIIYIRGSGTENGDIMRITSPDSTDILVQGCTAITVQGITPTDSTNIDINLATSYANTSGPDTITATYSVLYMYLISNGKYYRYCQQKQQEAPLGKIFQIDMTTAATSTTVTFNAPSNPENGGVYTFHFQNVATNDVDFPATFKYGSGTAIDGATVVVMPADFFMTCYYDGTNYYCK